MKSLVDRLDKRVTIMRPPGKDDADEYGEPVKDWIEVTKLWASIEPLRGQEYFAAMRDNAEVTVRIRIRYREGIDKTMKVVYGSSEFEILHSIHSELNKKELQLMCKERQ